MDLKSFEQEANQSLEGLRYKLEDYVTVTRFQQLVSQVEQKEEISNENFDKVYDELERTYFK